MARETKALKRERGREACRRLDGTYHAAESALDYSNPFKLVICVLLSAQTTDNPQELGEVIRTIGFWRAKAGHCIATAQMIVADYGGEVPRTMEELTRLPGVGRKTANIVLNKAYGVVEGIAVDTHVFRIAKRLRLTSAQTPAAAEKDLLSLLPHELWRDVNEQWIHFGRETCSAQRPSCDACPLADICPSFGQPNRWFKGKK